MKIPKVSVVVPIYNVEPYLRRCLDSLVNQTLKDIEIICINDCSPDNSLAILKEYAGKDERMKIIDFGKNQGVSIARNAGMEMAKGEYTGFVDPDDYVDLDFYEKLYLKAKEKESDITCAKVKKTIGVREYIWPMNTSRFGKWHFPCIHWIAIYKTAFLRLYSLKYPDGIKQGQDTAFYIQALFFANNVECGTNTYYHYIQREDSTSFNLEKFKFNARLLLIDFINEKITDKEEYEYVFEYLFKNYFMNIFIRFGSKLKNKYEIAKLIIDIHKKRKYQTVTLDLPKFIQESDLENAEALLKKINDNIRNIIPYENLNAKNLQNRKLYIWGAGLNGIDALSLCEENEWKVEAFLDSNRNLTEFNGYKVISPQDVLSGNAKDYFIIISSIRAYAADEIAHICEQAGLKEGMDFCNPFRNQ